MQSHPFRFFGSGIVTDQHGQPVALRSRKQLALLAYLAVEHSIAHSRETLQALFWAQEPTATAQNNLRVTLSRLREVAGKIGDSSTPSVHLSGDLVVTDRNAVQFHPQWVEHVDVNRFNHLLERTRKHVHASRSQCAHCQPLLQEAVALAQGEFLAGLGLVDCPEVEEWLLMQRERLKLLVGEAHHDLAVYAESQRDWVSARTHALRQIELDPLREPAYRQLMRVLAQLGERSAALAIFERCRTVLNEELGLDPEPETLALHGQLLNTSTLDAHQPLKLVAQPSSATPPLTNLPRQLTPFIGREAEIEQLQARLADPTYRLLSLVGPGGIGKSRLAQQVAAQQIDRFEDGVYFVPLAQVQTVESIPAVIAETVGLSFVATQKQPAEQLVEMLHAKHLLLVLDNFEHLIAGVDLLVEILQHAPKVVLLVTTREGLNLQAEDIFELQGLPTPTTGGDSNASTYAAVRLFVDRAHRIDKQFKLTAEQLPAVVRICQLVEGFPLALELAATWVRDLTCQEIVSELTQGLDLLETTLRDIDPQHRSLRAVFNSSWRLLSEPEQRLLLKLSIFRGGFNLDAARTITTATPALVSALRNKSLLRNAGSRRYDMHALVHQFATDRLTADGAEERLVSHAHSHYFLALLSEHAVALDTHHARTAADKIQPDWENVATAWLYATTHQCLDWLQSALDGLERFCDLRGLFQEVQTLLESSIAHVEAQLIQPDGADPTKTDSMKTDSIKSQGLHLLCRLQTTLAYFAGRRGLEQTRALSQQALVLAEQIDSRAEIIRNLIIQAAACELVADYPKASTLAERALEMAQTVGDELQAGLSLDVLGTIAIASSDYGRANELFSQVYAIHEKTGRIEQGGRAAIGRLGSVATEEGRYDVAMHYIQLYLESCQAIDDRRNLAHALHRWAYLWLRLGDFEKAIHFEEQSIARATMLGDRETCSFALQVKAWAHRQAGQLCESMSCGRKALELADAIDAQMARSFALVQLAETQLAMAQSEREWEEAAATFAETITRLRAIGKVVMAYEAEIGLAEVARRRGDLAAAQSLIEPLLPHLPTLSAEGWDEPIRAYGVCTEILRAVNDPRAESIQQQGLQLLECLAERITDPTLRQNFLHTIPAHRKIREL